MRAWDEVLINVAPVLIDDGAGLFSQKGMKPIGLAKAGVAEAGQLSPELMYYALLCEPDDDAERGRFPRMIEDLPLQEADHRPPIS